MDERLTAIEKRVKALDKWAFCRLSDTIIICGPTHEHKFYFDDDSLKAAERLLSLYEPGAVVFPYKIKHNNNMCSYECECFGDTYSSCGYICCMKWAISKGYSFAGESVLAPGPSCPGPGRYKLVRIDG